MSSTTVQNFELELHFTRNGKQLLMIRWPTSYTWENLGLSVCWSLKSSHILTLLFHSILDSWHTQSDPEKKKKREDGITQTSDLSNRAVLRQGHSELPTHNNLFQYKQVFLFQPCKKTPTWQISTSRKDRYAIEVGVEKAKWNKTKQKVALNKMAV